MLWWIKKDWGFTLFLFLYFLRLDGVLCYPPKCKIFTIRDWVHSFGVLDRQTKSYSIIWDLKRSPLRKSLHLWYSSTVHLFIFCLSSVGPNSYSPTRKRTTHNTHCTPDRYNRIANWISPHWNHQIKSCGQQWQKNLTKKKTKKKCVLSSEVGGELRFWQGANDSLTSFTRFHHSYL